MVCLALSIRDCTLLKSMFKRLVTFHFWLVNAFTMLARVPFDCYMVSFAPSCNTDQGV